MITKERITSEKPEGFGLYFKHFDLGKNVIVCICHGINEKAIRDAVANGACTASDIACATGASTCCGKCRDCVCEIVEEALNRCQLEAA